MFTFTNKVSPGLPDLVNQVYRCPNGPKIPHDATDENFQKFKL